MKELDPLILFAIFYEMLGPLLWVLLAIIVFSTLGFVLLVFKERGIQSIRLVRAQALGLIGAALSLVLMAYVSSSGFTDAGGPADWILIGLVFVVGWIGSTIVLYTLAGWCGCRNRRTACGAGRAGSCPSHSPRKTSP